MTRPVSIVPVLPNVDVPVVTQDGYFNDEWRRCFEQVFQQNTWEGGDLTLVNITEIARVDGKGTLTAFDVNADQFRINIDGGTRTPFEVTGDEETFVTDVFKIKGATTDVDLFSVIGDTVTMQNVRITGDLIVDGAITRGKAGANFFGAEETVELRPSPSTGDEQQLSIDIPAGSDSYIDVTVRIQLDQNNSTIALRHDTSAAAGGPIGYRQEFDATGTSGEVFVQWRVKAFAGTNYIKVDMNLDGGDTFSEMDITLVERPL